MYWYEVYRYAAAAMLVCSVVPDQPTEVGIAGTAGRRAAGACLLYTSDAADER